MISFRTPALASPRISCLARRPSRLLASANPAGATPHLHNVTIFPRLIPGVSSPVATSHRGQQQIRGKKTKTIVKLDDLPQGILPPPQPVTEADDGPAYPTVVQQARRNMQKFDNCVLLTRVGGFYELYFEHAEEYGPLLNLKVAQKRTNAGPVPMAGFPFFQLDRFLKILVQDLHRYVAVAEEFPNDPSEKIKSGGLMHDRRVARIITPGTLIDENFMDPYANNYVMAIYLPEAAAGVVSPAPEKHNVPPAVGSSRAVTPLGLAWLDLSTGYFFTQTTSLSSLPSVLSRVSPRELVLAQDLQSSPNAEIFSILSEDRHLITYAPPSTLRGHDDWLPMLESGIPADAVGTFTDDEIKAGSLLLDYVKDRLRGLSMKLQPPVRHENMQVMSIDRNSMRSLEIKQTIKDAAFRGSLLHAIRRTVTKSGARLLNEWLSSPSTSIDTINFRQDLVYRFIKEEDLRDGIILLLRRSHDAQRLVQKFAMNRGDPDDLLGLASTIKATDSITALLRDYLSASHDENDCLKVMSDRLSLEQPLQLATRILDAIDEEGLVQQHQLIDSETGQMIALAQEVVSAEGTLDDNSVLPKGAVAKSKRRTPSIREHYAEDSQAWIMKPGASPSLIKLHSQLDELHGGKAALAEELRLRHKAASLTLRWTPGLGHICHVKGKDARSSGGVTPVKTLSSSRTTRSFHEPEWTSLGERMDKVRFQIRSEEQRVVASLREQVVLNLVKLRRNAAVLDELDIATSFARLAQEQRLVRPKLTNSTAHTIVGGRHPTVEGGLTEAGRTFQRNDLFVGAPGHGRAWVITGPNMAGKSTFLRQNALITILAQIGSFVPADYAEIGVVDAIFSRVGSADNLYRDQSTFMVEMLETAAILHNATPRSFVIMDEIGRGTTPEDGTAVAFASLHHLVHTNKCRVLFATHFHGIADLVAEHGMRIEDGGEQGAVEMYCTDVEEDGSGGFVYVHKLRRGVNRQSHALKVAHLAGLPFPAMRVAQDVLETLGVARPSSGPEPRGAKASAAGS